MAESITKDQLKQEQDQFVIIDVRDLMRLLMVQLKTLKTCL